ncbi:hypothetical protein WRSd5_01651 [Shigella dysenteriae WRSd5]|nr:hypothetical protein WRSd5_01651 [Shigella dysenteriae WRSd5]
MTHVAKIMRNYAVTLAKRSCTMAMKSRNAGFISPFFHAISKAMEGTFPAMGRKTTCPVLKLLVMPLIS